MSFRELRRFIRRRVRLGEGSFYFDFKVFEGGFIYFRFVCYVTVVSYEFCGYYSNRRDF